MVVQHFAQEFDEKRRFVEAVACGEAALEQGEYLSHDDIGQCLERFLRA